MCIAKDTVHAYPYQKAAFQTDRESAHAENTIGGHLADNVRGRRICTHVRTLSVGALTPLVMTASRLGNNAGPFREKIPEAMLGGLAERCLFRFGDRLEFGMTRVWRFGR